MRKIKWRNPTAEDLARMQANQQAEAESCYHAGDVSGWLIALDDRTLAHALLDRSDDLRSRGLWERALYEVWSLCRWNWAHVPPRVFDGYFGLADRAKLASFGAPFDQQGSWRVYRGVAGVGCARRVNSFSWTTSLDVASWFAVRGVLFSLSDPGVYVRDITASDVYFRRAERGEDEFVCVRTTTRPKRLKISQDEMQAAADRYRLLRERELEAERARP